MSAAKSVGKSVGNVRKSVSKVNRSISKSIKKTIDGPFDTYNLFENCKRFTSSTLIIPKSTIQTDIKA